MIKTDPDTEEEEEFEEEKRVLEKVVSHASNYTCLKTPGPLQPAHLTAPSTQLLLVLVPEGVVNPQSLINSEVVLGGQKERELVVGGRRCRLTTHPTGPDLPKPPTLFLPNQHGKLMKVNARIDAHVLLTGELEKDSKENYVDIEALYSAHHQPPSDIRERDFFKDRARKTPAVAEGSQKKRKKEKAIQEVIRGVDSSTLDNLQLTNENLPESLVKKREKKREKLQLAGIDCETPNRKKLKGSNSKLMDELDADTPARREGGKYSSLLIDGDFSGTPVSKKKVKEECSPFTTEDLSARKSKTKIQVSQLADDDFLETPIKKKKKKKQLEVTSEDTLELQTRDDTDISNLETPVRKKKMKREPSTPTLEDSSEVPAWQKKNASNLNGLEDRKIKNAEKLRVVYEKTPTKSTLRIEYPDIRHMSPQLPSEDSPAMGQKVKKSKKKQQILEENQMEDSPVVAKKVKKKKKDKHREETSKIKQEDEPACYSDDLFGDC